MSVVIRTARRHRFNGLLAAFQSSLAAWRGDRFEATGACLRYMSTRSRRRSEERKRKLRMQKFKAAGNQPLRVAGPRELPEGLGSSTHDLKGKCLMAEKDYDVGEVIATAPVWGFVPPLAQAREDSWCARVKLHLPGEGGDGYEAYVDPLTPGPITRHLDPAKVRKAFALSFEPFLDFMGCGGTGSRQPVVAAILFLRSLGFLGHPQVRWTKPPVVRPDLIDEDEEDEVIAARLNLNNDFFKKSMEGFGLLTSVAHEAWGEAGQGMFKGDYETLRNVMKNLLRSPDAADTILRSYFPFKNYVTVRGVIRVNGFGLPLEDLWCEARSPTEQLDGHFEQPGDLTGLAVPPPEEQGGDDKSKVVDGEGSAEGSATSEAATGDPSSSKDNPRDMATAPSAAVGADGVPRHVTPSGLSTPALDPAGWAGSLLTPDVGKAEAQGLGQGQGSPAGEGAIDGGVVENLGGKAPGVTNEKDGSDHGRGAADPEEGPGSSSMQAVGQPQSVGTHDGDGRASILQQLAEHAQAQSSQAQQLKDGGLQYSAPTDRASALFGPVVSLMNHSCHPNVDFRVVVRVPSQSADSAAPKRAVMLNSPDQRPVRAGESVWEEEFDVFTRSAVYTRLVARRPVKKGDELMITYIDANRPADARYNLLRDSFNFECACERKCDLDDVEAEQYRQQAAAAAMEAGRGSGYDLEGRPIFAEDGEDGDETEAEWDAQSAAPREEGVPVFPDAEEQEKLMQRLARRRSKQDVDREQGMEAMSESARQTGEVAKELSESQAARSMATSPFVHPDRHYGTNVGKVFHVAEVDVSDSEDEDEGEGEGAAQEAAGKAAAAGLDAGSGSRAPASSIPEQESGAPRVPGLASPLELARRKRQAQARLAEKLKAAGGGDGHNEGGSGRQ